MHQAWRTFSPRSAILTAVFSTTLLVLTACGQASPTATSAPAGTPGGGGAPSGLGDAARGKTVYSTNCAACHGANAEGGVGPNLVASKVAVGQIKQQVRNGSANKVMPAFTASQISDADLDNLAAYLASIGAAK
ncbi:MAG: cytochrome c [Chloroflexi bacterium]|nr:cytochrome c [Chloroflexota bacterium]